MAGLNFLRVVDNATLVSEEQNARKEMEDRQAEPLMIGLSGYLRSAFDAAKISFNSLSVISSFSTIGSADGFSFGSWFLVIFYLNYTKGVITPFNVNDTCNILC